MKKFVAILTLPVIFLISFFAAKSFVAGDYFTAYLLVFGWFASFVLWIQNVGLLFERKPAVVIPAAPRAYISLKKIA